MSLDGISAGAAAADGCVRVLIVDDTAQLRYLLGRALQATGRYRVVAEADDGSSGIDAARTHRPDLVMLDLQMKGMDGWEALPVLRELLPNASIVVFSGHGDDPGVVAHSVTEGADAVVSKGTPLAKVLTLLDTLP